MEQENFQATTPSFDDQVYQDWLKDYKERNGTQVAFDETERKAFNTKTNKDRPLDYSKWYQGDDTDAHADWKQYQYKRERDRFNTLDPVAQDKELVSNTHKYEETPILGRFSKAFTKSFTMGLVDTGEDDNPVYGKKVGERYGAVSTAGSFLGEIANFVVLSQVAAGLKVPQSIAKVAEGSSQAATLLRATGGVNYKLGQINKIVQPLLWFGQKTAPAIGTKFGSMAEAAGEATARGRGLRALVPAPAPPPPPPPPQQHSSWASRIRSRSRSNGSGLRIR
jgi:hypothetical protein